MKSIRENFIVFSFGGIIYSIIEVLFRGYTHWTMTITGGIAFLSIYLINKAMKISSLFIRCLVGSAVITGIEFIVGLIVNKGLNMNVWDYSDEKYNVLGQICPLFSTFWFILCIPGTIISFLLRRRLSEHK